MTGTWYDADILKVDLYVSCDQADDDAACLQRVLDVIDAHAGVLTPDKIKEKKGKSYNYTHERARMLLSLQEKEPVAKVLVLSRNDALPVNYRLTFFKQHSLFPRSIISLVLPFALIQATAQSATIYQQIITLVRAVANKCQIIYGWGHHDGDASLGSKPSINKLATQEVREVYWLNVFGAAMVARIGHDRVVSTPAAYIETLNDGSILVMPYRDLTTFVTDEARNAQANALVHLRGDANQAAILAQLSKRTATLAPIVRDWDPDIAELLELTLHELDVAHRQQRIAQLNHYRPPQVTEWCSIEDAPASDVATIKEAIAHYHNLYAESLVALLYQDIPTMMQASPDSLHLVDYHFWQHEEAERLARDVIDDKLVPALGAYLGKVMVRNLGGTWVPRQRLDESYIHLGTRAWYPFRRAHHALQSKQAAIDYALVTFYRTAERHIHRKPEP